MNRIPTRKYKWLCEPLWKISWSKYRRVPSGSIKFCTLQNWHYVFTPNIYKSSWNGTFYTSLLYPLDWKFGTMTTKRVRVLMNNNKNINDNYANHNSSNNSMQPHQVVGKPRCCFYNPLPDISCPSFADMFPYFRTEPWLQDSFRKAWGSWKLANSIQLYKKL